MAGAFDRRVVRDLLLLAIQPAQSTHPADDDRDGSHPDRLDPGAVVRAAIPVPKQYRDRARGVAAGERAYSRDANRAPDEHADVGWNAYARPGHKRLAAGNKKSAKVGM